MRVLLLLALAASAWASDSFVNATTGRRATITFPGGAPMCSNTNSFRLDISGISVPGGWGTIGTNQEFLRQANNWGLNIDSTGYVGSLIVGGGGGPFISGISGWNNFRLRFQRDTANSRYTYEVWNEATGERKFTTAVDPSPGTVTFPDCLIYLGSNSTLNTALVNLGAVRIYSTVLPLDSAPPVRLLTSSFADVVDLELELNLNDSSGRGLTTTMTTGSAAYATTPTLPPVGSISGPTTVRAGGTATLVTSCISNEDSPTCSLLWNQTGSSNGLFGEWSNRTSATIAGIKLPVFGQYDLLLTLTTGTQSATTEYTVGASATDDRDVVIIADPDIAAIVGPIIRSGANPWSWYDTRDIYSGQFQINMQTGVSGSPAFWSQTPWATNLAGTISVTGPAVKGAVGGSATITGTGTNFQADFCGGGTSPVTQYNQIYIKYDMLEYPGTKTLARYGVVSCNSATSMTVNQTWGHALNTQSGLNYARADADVAGFWTNTNTPGNYYDNVLAFYLMYYRTGLTKYRDAARTLARGWWEGPMYGRGGNYDLTAVGGTFIAAGPARGQSITGLILWALDTGENIWPGMAYVMASQRDFGWKFMNDRGWTSANVQLGDLREQAYFVAAYALYSRFAMTSPGVPDATARANYRQYTKDYINLLLEPMQFPTGEWRWTSIQNLNISGTPYVTTTNGSTSVTLVNSDWTAANFCVGNCGAGAYQAWVWFFTNRTNSELPGKQNSDLGGDAAIYKLVSMPAAGDTTAILVLTDISGSWSPGNVVTQSSSGATGTVVTYDVPNKRLYLDSVSGTFAPGAANTCAGQDVATGGNTAKVCQIRYTSGTLNSAYAGTNGNKGAIVSSIVGFGNQPFMQGIMVKALGTYVKDAMIFHGDTTEATKAQTMATLGATWLTTSDAFRAADHELYGASLFLNCVINPINTGCEGGTVLNGEAMGGVSAAYIAAPTAPLLAQGDELYNSLWCKPTGGWTCPIASYGIYADFIDDIGVSGSFMNSPTDPLTNKWFGYFFGYGGGASWPVARVGGVRPADNRTVKLAYTAPGGTSATTVTCTAPNGLTAAPISCSAGNCDIPQDWRQGNYVCRLAHTVTGGTMAGDLVPLIAQ
jgi:hypothetical protein